MHPQKTSRNSEQRVHSKFAAIEDVCMNEQQSLVYTAMRGDRFVLEWGVQVRSNFAYYARL